MSNRILVVEDDPNARELLESILTVRGHTVHAFENSLDALRWLKKSDTPPHAAVLDWMVPDISGLELCEQIRKHYSQQQLPILMLSALGDDPSYRTKGLQAGANDFVSKPYDTDELLARISTLLETRQPEVNYVSKSLRRSPDVLEERRSCQAVVMFADLRGFTTASNQTPPGEVASLLNDYFKEMGDLIERNGGTVLDLIGDEILAAFNVPYDIPSPEKKAVETAMAMHDHFAAIKQRWQDMDVGIGIGINSGEVMLGNIGSNNLQRFTIVGNAVNVAHRLVEVANEGETVISGSMYYSLTARQNYSARQATLKGLAGARTVYVQKYQPTIDQMIDSVT